MASVSAAAEAEARLARTVVDLALDEVNDVREGIRSQTSLALGLLTLNAAVAVGVVAAAAAKASAPPPVGHWPSRWWWPIVLVTLSSLLCARVMLSSGAFWIGLEQLYRASRAHLPDEAAANIEIATALLVLARTRMLPRFRERYRLIVLAAALLGLGLLVGVVRFVAVFK